MEISELAGRIRDHRFDGWTDTAIADEIEKFGTGDGIASIATAVEALREIATALASTDHTLRDQLAKLGVEWQSQAGGQAGQVLSDQAGFSQDAMQKVTHTAEMLFAQGEAFNRTKYKLPDPAAVRKGAESLTLVDSVASFLGFETDHAAQVQAADNARGQAVEALNAYAQQSGENLLSTEPLSQPQSLAMVQPGSGPSPVDRAAAAVEVTPDGQVQPAAASVKSQYVPPPPPPAPPVVDPPTPAYGTASQAPAPRPVAPVVAASYVPPSSPPPAGWETGPAPHGNPPRSVGSTNGPGIPSAPSTSGGSGGTRVPGGPGQSGTFLPTGPRGTSSGSESGPVSRGTVGSSESLGGTSGSGRSSVGGQGGNLGGAAGGSYPAGGQEYQALQRGRLVGSVPQAPVPPVAETPGNAPAPRAGGASAGEIGAGAAALGAGVAGGALSGDRERQGRGQDGQPKGPVRPLPVDELPEEEAVALRKAEQIAPKSGGGDAKYLSEAAPQESDDEHVRRFGVDDKDLFADGRMVTRDVLGDGTGDVRRP
ncbi:PPE domain-containing protein [Amycolatopsis sp. Poz14]|uniref:PPE domain-containing protein n=1 Tax=Amycolatopsis sp. Poz14 TaxID=1447705 RepID=UPI00055A0B03|nr:PPE domain-containing protein [Amycolatopsis sp. Poz14]MCG3749794.1 PPE domain-containing protein [Amycolatopsis sp. Poz14]